MAMLFTTENYDTEVLKSEKPVLVDFYADWCGPCKMMGPVIEQLAGEYEGKAVVGKLNIDNDEEIAARYGIMTIPTILVLKDGVEKAKFVGVTNKAELSKAIDSVL